MKNLLKWCSACLFIVMACCSYIIFAQEQKPKVYTYDDLKKIKINELKDNDIIDVNGKKYSVAELKELEKKSFDLIEQIYQIFAPKVMQKLNEYQKLEESKEKARVENIRKEINSILNNKKIKSTKNSPNYPDCEKATIFSVYPATVYPGDPVLIEGCNFLSDEGMVLITGNRINLINESWKNDTIIATLPRLKGFADPYQIVLEVQNTKGEISNLSQKILLNPNMSFRFLDNRSIVSINVNPQKCYYSGESDVNAGVYYMGHNYFPGIDDSACSNGTDTLAKDMKFKNHWKFHSFMFEPQCFSINGGNYDLSFCDEFTYAKLVENLEKMISNTSISLITVNWSGNVVYFGSFFLYGPNGTTP